MKINQIKIFLMKFMAAKNLLKVPWYNVESNRDTEISYKILGRKRNYFRVGEVEEFLRC